MFAPYMSKDMSMFTPYLSWYMSMFAPYLSWGPTAPAEMKAQVLRLTKKIDNYYFYKIYKYNSNVNVFSPKSYEISDYLISPYFYVVLSFYSIIFVLSF